MATAAASAGDATPAENGSLATVAANPPAEDGNTLPGKDSKLSAGQQRRQRRKLQKAAKQSSRKVEDGTQSKPSASNEAQDEAVEYEYVSAPREYEGLGAAEQPAENGLPSAAADPGLDGRESSPAGSAMQDDMPSTGGLGLGASGREDEDGDEAGGGGLGLGAGGGLGLGASPAGLGLGSSAQQMQAFLGFAPAGGAPQQTAQKDPYADFASVFDKFASAEEVTGAVKAEPEEDGAEDELEEAPQTAPVQQAERDSDADSDEGDDGGVSKKKRKSENRLKIAALKQLCPRPEVVEVWDVTAPDPQLLVYLKAYRNTVPVPRHWSQKRKFLQGKRGIEKPAFQLPDFIEATGISEMRKAYQEKEDAKKLKSKQRSKMQPKMGKLGMDYQMMHEAFFKYQSKPHLTRIGDLYYEGKEFEARFKGAKPGVMGEDLRRALGMSDNTPPPWLINMQRYGPPPSYPDLKVPGLSAPIPPGAQFGFQPGGWGKAPVNEHGEPLYGDVFGQHMDDDDDLQVDKAARWGDLESEEEEEEEEEAEEEVSEDEATAEDTIADGLSSVASGYSSLPSGIETPDVLDLRKAKAAGTPADRPLYQVLEQRAAGVGAGALMGSDHTYVLPPGEANRPRRREGDVEVAINPEELEGLDDAAVQALYRQRLEAQQQSQQREDFSDLVAQKANQQKRKAEQTKQATAAKKQKDFKF